MTALLSKKGIENVPANLALAVRVGFILVLAVGIALFTRETKVSSLTPRAWAYLGGSAIATGGSWLCYFRALQAGPVSKVAPIDKLSFVVAMLLGVFVLKEPVSLKVWCGAAMIVGGVLLTIL